jgi:hypothetical protein
MHNNKFHCLIHTRWKIKINSRKFKAAIKGNGGYTMPGIEEHHRSQPCLLKLRAQWKSLVAREGALECHLEYADGRTKMVQSVSAAKLRNCWQICMKDL